MKHDYSGFQKTSEGDMAQLAVLAAQQLEEETAVAQLEDDLKAAKKQLAITKEFSIPELMDKLHLTEFSTTSGLKIKVKETIRAAISKANQADAYAWLRANGHEALIRRKIIVEFGVGEDAEAAAALEALQEQELQIDDDASVHTQTLGKFVREMLGSGQDVPIELFGIHRQRVSAVTV